MMSPVSLGWAMKVIVERATGCKLGHFLTIGRLPVPASNRLRRPHVPGNLTRRYLFVTRVGMIRVILMNVFRSRRPKMLSHLDDRRITVKQAVGNGSGHSPDMFKFPRRKLGRLQGLSGMNHHFRLGLIPP